MCLIIGSGIITAFLIEPYSSKILNKVLGHPYEIKKKSKIKYFIIMSFTWFFYFIFLFIILIPPIVDLQLNTSFNQRLIVLEASVTEKEAKELKSCWALMKTRNDYLMINVKMDSLAKRYNITLPKPLVE